MNQPFTLDHLKHFEAELKSPAQVCLLQYFAKRCATMRDNGQMANPDEPVRFKFELSYVAHTIGVYEVKPLITVELFGSRLVRANADKERDARARVWNCIRNGEKFVQFNKPDEPGGRFAMVWFHFSASYQTNYLLTAETTPPPKPENIRWACIGINADFVDAMVEYGHALFADEESEESGATQ